MSIKNAILEGARREDGGSKNPFHRAKKHIIKTLIGKLSSLFTYKGYNLRCL